jgi:hypothetical protein
VQQFGTPEVMVIFLAAGIVQFLAALEESRDCYLPDRVNL